MKLKMSIITAVSLLFIACMSKEKTEEKLPEGYIDLVNIEQLPETFYREAKPAVAQERSDFEKRVDTLFKKVEDPMKAFNLFKKELPEAKKLKKVPHLMSYFFYRSGVRHNKKNDETRKEVMKKIVALAMAETDEEVKQYFAQYSNNYNFDGRLYINLNKNAIRPGEKIRLQGYSYWNFNSKSSEALTVQLSRLTFDENMKPTGFKEVSIDTIEAGYFTNRHENYDYQIDSAGVYKITLYNETTFRQFYCQASWLDGLVKTDNSKLLVYGSSYRDTLAGPYSVHFVSPEGEVYSTKTDSKGVVAVGHKFPEEFRASSMETKVILQKGDQLAFIQGYITENPEQAKIQNYLYSDRPVYRPGNVVRFRGVSKRFIREAKLANADLDSITMQIMDPQGTEVFSKKLSVDEWGHFGDTLTLSATAKQGIYSMRVHSMVNRDRNKPVPAMGYAPYQNATFIVEAYKKPEFLINLSAEKESFTADDTVKINVKGEYYFGGALAKTPVKVRWYRQDMYHYFNYWGNHRRCFFYPYGSREFLFQSEDTLDEKGELQLKYKPELNRDQSYFVAEVIATDKSRREIREEISVKAVKNNGYLSFNLDKYNYELNDEAQIEVLAVDLEGNALKAPLSLRVKKDRQIVVDTMLAINEQGSAYFTYKLDEIGTYTLEAVTKDGSGKTIYRDHSINVQKVQNWNWNWERIEVTTDKDSYSFGDTAVITVKTGADSTGAFCTIEGRDVRIAATKQISDHAFEFRLPVTRELGYNIQFYTAFSGKSRLSYRTQRIVVEDSSSLLTVELQGEKDLKPGDTFTGNLKVTDSEGKPVQANFSVALVDEAIYAVAKAARKNSSYGYYHSNDTTERGILSLFPSYYNSEVRTNISQFHPKFLDAVASVSQVVEKKMKSEQTNRVMARMKSGVVETFEDVEVMGYMDSPTPLYIADADMSFEMQKSEEAPAPAPRERTDFRDIAFWDPSVTTDENGTAVLSFSMPDDLTKWRLVLVGCDGHSQLIDFRDSLITKQDIMVKLQAPRSVVEGDSLLVSAVVHNYSKKDITATVKLNLKDDTSVAQILSKETVKLKLKKGETKSLDWSVKILKKGEFTCYTSVTSSEGGDAESRSYPILINGIPRAVSSVGVLGKDENSAVIDLALPEDGLKGSREVTISYSPSLAFSLFESLDYLTGYPYGCVEQTMSRFLPNLYVASVMKRLNMENDSLLAKIPEYTEKGVDRLSILQHRDGGWGWWGSDDSDPRMTALVVYGLSYAMNSEILSDEIREDIYQILVNGTSAALRQLNAKSTELEQQVALAYALVTHYGDKSPKEVKQKVESFYEQRGKLTSGSLAKLLEMNHTLGLKGKKELISLLNSQVNSSGSSAYWNGSSNYRWYRQDEETTAMVVRALVTADPENKHLEAAVMWLSRQKRNGYWVSTKTTAAVVEALSHYLENSKEFNPDFTGTVTLGKREVLSKKITTANFKSASGEIILSEKDLKAGKLEIALNGKGRLYYSVNLRYVTDENPIKKHDNGIDVKRSYQKIVYSQKKDGDWIVKRVPFTGECKSGDEIEVTVTVTSGSNLEHLMLEDYFPSGMEVLQKPQNWYDRWCGYWYWGYTHKEARDDRMVFFMGDMHKGTQTFTYLLRAETPGKFTALPARAECMYEPEVNGNSKADVVTITE